MANSDFSSRTQIQFTVGIDVIFDGELRSVLAPRTIERILAIMPINSRIHLWKKELYFEIGIRMGPEKGVAQCNAGDIAYWPQGDAICIFFETMKPYSKVNPLGTISKDDFGKIFEKLRSGMAISLRVKP